MPVNLNYMVEKGSQLVKSSALKPIQYFNTQEIKYAPKQLSDDVVETSIQQLRNNVDKIASMRKIGVTQVVLAKQFGISRTYFQKILSTHLPDATPESRKLTGAIRKYFLSTNLEEKNKAFKVIDSFLQQVAKEKSKLQRNYSYEDHLQDLRLNFINTVNQNAGNAKYNFKNLAYKIKQSGEQPPKFDEPIHVSLSELEKDGSPIAEMDLGIKAFEDNDYKLKQVKKLSDRERVIVHLFAQKNKSLEEIGDILWLTSNRIKQIISDKIAPKMESFKDLPAKPKQ